MKKLLALLLVLAMVFALVACGTDSDRDDRDDDDIEDDRDDDDDDDKMIFVPDEGTDTDSVGDDSDAETDADTDEVTPDTETPVTEAPVTEPTIDTVAPDTEIPADAESMFGYFDGVEYVNYYFGFACDLGAAEYVATDRELAEFSGVSPDSVDRDPLEYALDQYDMAYMLYASNNGGLATINAAVEDIGIAGLTIGEEEYIDIAEPQLAPALEAVGLSNITTEKLTVEFAGEEHWAVKVTGEYEGIYFYELIVTVKRGDYIACITIAVYEEDTTDIIAGGFYAP